ncbi:MAG: elongation factor G [Lachnospiraceae bacterium]|jgi:elongation factor G|nr:elongation factor G [Lachnospiraceae bacterium]MCI1453637.1 elongation factor G [Lachnospiraceae bacterium]
MKVFTTDKIRNVVVLGHGSAGKTTLVEAMAYLGGLTSRLGKIEEKNTVSDFTKEEQKRGISIHTSVIPIEWEGYKLNILDTPGYFDFVGEVEEALAVADGAIIVVSGKSGIEAGTEKAWELCEKYHLPRMIFVTDMDIDSVSYRKTIEDLTALYSKKIAPFNMPIRENGKLTGYVNVIQKKGFVWNGKEVVPSDVPDYSREYLEQYHDTLMEAVAETSEEFMERYFAGEEFSEAEIRAAARLSIQDGTIVPVEMGSGLTTQGVYTLMDDIVKYMPSAESRKVSGINVKTSEIFEANFDVLKPKTAFVFKTVVDPFIGRYSLIKIRSGVFKTDELVYDASQDAEFKIGKLYVMQGNKTAEVPELHAGDLGALAKLTEVKTGDTLSTKATPVTYPRMEISQPYTYLRYKAVNKADIDKIAQAMAKIAAEDPTFKAVNDAANGQSLIYGMGDLHLQVIQDELANEYNVKVEIEKPKVAFRETIRKNSDVEYKYKKQSGGHGQYGHVKMKFGPSGDLTTPYVFDEEVVGGAVPKNYFPAVEKGIAESVQRGPLAAYPVVGVHATLYDGSYHPVDSSEMAFKTAAKQAFKKGFMEASPVLLEPIVNLKVTVPDTYTGDVMGDLNKRRGRVLGMNPIPGGKQVIEADVPQMELFDYCTQLRSMTGGRGEYEYHFARYEQCPADIQSKEVAARAEEAAAGFAEG